MNPNEELFLSSHCGTFALELFELFNKKVKLGMLVGSRVNKWDEEETVNIHSFVIHPANSNLGIDATGVFNIALWEERWLFNEKFYGDSDARVEFLVLDEEEFLDMLQGTGSPERTPDVKALAQGIIQLKKLTETI